jgi:Protein of unknown function (DUF1615)
MRAPPAVADGVCGPVAALLLAVLAGCAVDNERNARSVAPPRPDEVRARIVSLMPSSVPDRAGWAVDIYAALTVLRIEPRVENLCAVLAVAEQESTYRVDPPVPRLGAIAWAEIDRRAESAGAPRLLVHGALQLRSSDGRSYAERIDAARTEHDLSATFEDLIDAVPLGHRLFAGYNPVHTAGPMQVSIEFAERQAKEKPYPYPMGRSVRDEVFTRRGGLYFGIAHLLDYPAAYDQPIYRYADFNAGRYASRNAAFQNAVSVASGVPLDLDGDLVRPGGDPGKPGSTEIAVRTLGAQLHMGEGAIRQALEKGVGSSFDREAMVARVYELADRAQGRSVPRAVLPRITLKSPKITRTLTTEWFANRVDERYRRCLTREP